MGIMHIDGVETFVETLPGRGECNFVLIHNAGSDHRFFTHQLDLLRRFGHVVQMDLPGSGRSRPIVSFAMKDLASHVEKICQALALKQICVIGLNNGANIAMEMELRHVVPLHLLVLIDPPIFMDHAFVNEIRSFIERLKRSEYDPQFVASLVEALFLKTDPNTRNIARDAFDRVDKDSLQRMFQGLLKWDAASSGTLTKIACPTLCILTDEHHCRYDRMRKEAPQFELGKVIGSKCWATLEVPEQINAMIARFLTLHLEK